MMLENKISLEITDEEIKEIQDAVNVLRQRLEPKLVRLTPDERKELIRMSGKAIDFVYKAYDHAKDNPKLVPGYLEVPEMKKDMEAVNKLNDIMAPLELLCSLIDDSIALAGSEAYVAALAFFTAVKGAAKMNIPGSEQIYESLRDQRFPHHNRD